MDIIVIEEIVEWWEILYIQVDRILPTVAFVGLVKKISTT